MCFAEIYPTIPRGFLFDFTEYVSSLTVLPGKKKIQARITPVGHSIAWIRLGVWQWGRRDRVRVRRAQEVEGAIHPFTLRVASSCC